jgi:hypothetical protein
MKDQTKKEEILEVEKEKTVVNAPKKTSKIDREAFWLFAVMIGLIAIFLVSNSIFEELNNFEYQGLSFTKETFGEIPVYRYYYYTHPSAITASAVQGDPTLINLLLRVDPRENNVTVDGEIDLPPKNKFVYISINDTGINDCEYIQVGLANLVSFLIANGFEVKGAVPDEVIAEEISSRHVTCDTHPNNGVILIQAGQESKITRQDNCYTMDVSSCNILDTTEKFQIQTILDAKKRAGAEGNTIFTITNNPETGGVKVN